MSDHENLETELRRLKPATPPQDFMTRLAVISPAARQQAEVCAPHVSAADAWRQILRWLVPATAGVSLVIAAMIWWPPKPGPEPVATSVPVSAKAALKLDAVQIDRQMVTAYDALAELPGGEHVRFRCQEWMDAVLVRDAASGLLIEQRTPRFEIVAARLDTF